ncbi:tudor domain-containing protein 7 isoform X2 [Scaptodrosophila lebanonensis]|uniref:Tudor domain-containing protein 7 isoform X2 n=1 Tax=Drosophila lebanonensis TaxID=7225 RepID=A0A6J2TKP4_DROLE|nr:tudor domain-containing protein 7 isoform X2 [Scaptodrosophila lebanonensis]
MFSLYITAKISGKSEHIVNAVRNQKKQRSKQGPSRAPAIRRFGVGGGSSDFSGRINYSYAQQIFQQQQAQRKQQLAQQQQQQQQQQQLAQKQQALKQQQLEAQQKQEQEQFLKRQEKKYGALQQQLEYLRKSQNEQKAELQTKLDRQLKELQERQGRNFQEQAQVVRKLREEVEELLREKQNLEYVQYQQHRKKLTALEHQNHEREKETASLKAKHAEQQRQLQESSRNLEDEPNLRASEFKLASEEKDENLSINITSDRCRSPLTASKLSDRASKQQSSGPKSKPPVEEVVHPQTVEEKIVSEGLLKIRISNNYFQPTLASRLGAPNQPPGDRSVPTMNGNTRATTPQRKPLMEKPPLRPILGHSAHLRTGSDHLLMTPLSTPTYKRHSHLNNSVANKSLQAAGTGRTPPAGITSGSKSVNDRLKMKLPVATSAELMTPPATPESSKSKGASSLVSSELRLPSHALETPKTHQMVARSKPNKSRVPFNFDAIRDPVACLQQYCMDRNYDPPSYKIYRTGMSVHCTIRIDNLVYSCYPKEYPDTMIAKRMTAEIAVEGLRVLESRKRLPVCTLTDEEFMDVFYQGLLKFPNGIVEHKLPEWYEKTFQQQLPSNWWSLVSESSKIRVESGPSMIIVYAINSDVPASRERLGASTTPDLQMPWTCGSQGWSMYITHCTSVSHVWGQLIGCAYTNDFDQLTQDLNACMARVELRRAVQDPCVGQLYAVQLSDSWNRVRVISLDVEQRSCCCFFIDFGDISSFAYEDMFELDTTFLQLPAQAVCLSMYGLESYQGHPHAQLQLSKELVGRTVVAKIMTTETQFVEAGNSTGNAQQAAEKEPACIVALFYDTSTPEDINLNEQVARQINRATPSPQLKLEQKSNPVIVSHINDGGDLFVLLPNEDLKFVQRSISKIMATDTEHKNAAFADLQHDRLFFVCDESAEGIKQWHRGMLTYKPKQVDAVDVYDVYYVDDGRMRKTHLSNIYRLEALNRALASYPAQALRVRLHDVPPIDNQMVGRLRGLMSPQSEVLLKVMEGASDQLPMVTIHARGLDGLYLCVNSAIRMEHEIQSSARLEPFDDGGLHFSPSGQLLRRSSFSSTVSNNSTNSNEVTPTTTTSVAVTPPISPIKMAPMLKAYEAIPAVGAYFEVRVALSVNPGHFAVQPYKFYNQLQSLMKELQAHCQSPKAERVLPTQLLVGQAYAALDSDGVYHRVIIYKIYDEMIHVRFVDFGDDGVVRCDQLVQLPKAMYELPKMSLRAQLYGIKLEDVDWTQENCVRFRKLTLGQKFIGIVRRVDRVKEELRSLCLELIDTSTPLDIKIHEILIKEQHAQPAA